MNPARATKDKPTITLQAARPRFRQLGFSWWELSPGEHNAITDVPGVRVGHTSLVSGEGPLVPGVGPVRTGVSVILPHGGNLYLQKVPAAVHTINGFGKPAGFEQVRELGVLESPVALTNTLNVGIVLDALITWSIGQNPDIGVTTGSLNAVVGEVNDGFLNDLQGRHVRPHHVWQALELASGGPVSEGNVGAGVGTCCLGWKGGIGTASRLLPPEGDGYVFGAFVQTNFGSRRELVVGGVPAGRLLPPAQQSPFRPSAGSVMVVLATDAPLDSRQLGRLCRRVVVGLARTGAVVHPGSGDFVIAFSTAADIPHDPQALGAPQARGIDEPRLLAGLFQAVIESVEEAVLNSLTAAESMTGRDGHTADALPVYTLQKILAQWLPVPDEGGSTLAP